MTPLLSLPTDVLHEILTRTDAQTRAKFAQTCKQVRLLVNSEELYQSVLRKDYDLAIKVCEP
jgi:hypothetical protein